MTNRLAYINKTLRFLSRVKWKSLFLGMILVFGFLSFVALATNLRFWYVYQTSVHSDLPMEIPEAEVAIVPGAAVYGKTPSPILMDRLACGLDLYATGRVKKILLSGDNGKSDYNELRPMLEFMLNHKVKPEDIFVDHAGFRTLDTLIRAKEVFLVKKAIFVSQSFFLPRAIYLGKELELELYGFECNLRTYKKETYYSFREFSARVLAWWDIQWDTPPKYLGKPYPIEGSGVSTWKGSIPISSHK
ncbi:membrane permeability protein SanA [Leptospira meyeri]|nr:ElyC/SanA/YdcF family protein [Leptospira meyeri]TGL51088.1 membrane permeability protein SanA [Leptospira meyeri]TGM64258.1 membrane permeability protein SanA [Leptospira meyeri]